MIAWPRLLAAVAGWGACVAVATGCAPASSASAGGDAAGDVAAVSFATPRALLACAAPPADLEARMWISGSEVPCGLDVDAAAGTTSGACDARPGLVRTLTLDWFAARGGIDLLLAQARGSLDLTQGEDAEVVFTVEEQDVVTVGCVDASRDQVEGAATIAVNGVDVPVCDVDDSCAGADGPCSNLGELCASTDPFDAGDEP